MNELQRQQYLDAMGIDTYMPRWILPHAPLPVACDVSFLPELLTADIVANAATTGSTAASAAVATTSASAASAALPVAASGRPADVLAVLSTTEGKPQADTQRVAELVGQVASKQKQLQPVPTFALSIWRISKSLLIVDSRQAQLALPTEPLLINILVALGYPRQPLPKTDIVRWPMVNDINTDQSEAAAREMLEAYIESQFGIDNAPEDQPRNYLLLMGEAAARYILPATGTGDDSGYTQRLGQNIALDALAVNAIVVPSLVDMLLAPESKRLTWQALQPLLLQQSTQQSTQHSALQSVPQHPTPQQ